MIKEKLIELRIAKGYSQKQIAEKLFMDVSTYSRREKGQIKISNQEWIKLSQILETPLETIFESEEGMTFIYNDNSSGNSGNHFYSIPQFIMDNQRKYIEKLEEENQALKIENERLQSKDGIT